MSVIIMQHSPPPASSCLPQYKCQHPLLNTPSISFASDTKLTVKDTSTTATELLLWLRTCLRKPCGSAHCLSEGEFSRRKLVALTSEACVSRK